MTNVELAPEEIKAPVGAEFEISLRCGLAMGFVWVFESDDSVVYVGSKESAEGSLSGYSGGQKEVHVFRVLSPGVHRFAARFLRPWEDTPAETRHFLVRAKED